MNDEEYRNDKLFDEEDKHNPYHINGIISQRLQFFEDRKPLLGLDSDILKY